MTTEPEFFILCYTCDKKVSGEDLKHCIHLNHSFGKMLTGNSLSDENKGILEKNKINNGEFHVDTIDGNSFDYQILGHEIKNLYSHAVFDGVSYVCVYLPTQVQETTKSGKATLTSKKFMNMGYFVLYDPGRVLTQQKRMMPVTEAWLSEQFKVNVTEHADNVRWSHKDLRNWINTDQMAKPKDLFEKLNSIIRKYLEFDNDSTYAVLILWIIGTYFYRLFDAYPYLNFTGSKRAGKTKALELIKFTSFNSIMSPDFTGSSLFRLIELTGATIVLDEVENFGNKKSESAQHIRTLIMQGFLKDQYAYRTNTDKMMAVESFNLYSPKALGHINSFDDVLDDRCINIIMKRTTNKSILNSHPDQNESVFAEIRNLCYRVFLENARLVDDWKNKAEQLMPVYGRERLLWHPLITLAMFFESLDMPGLINLISKYAKESHSERQIIDEEQNVANKISNYLISNLIIDSWVITKILYHDLIAKADDYGINPAYLSPRKFTEILRQLGLKDSRRNTGIGWIMSEQDKIRIKTTYLDNPPSNNATLDTLDTHLDRKDGNANASSVDSAVSAS
ncbi:Putative phage protein, primase-like [Nitrosotalea devaniterrae]|uniref:Phage protein, primase-like n=1 Tax=Nitrosotalea devaniterrae TaxID=1078905 RepID=A0A128A1X2_9ARCH|nr:Putative phage protein, primase-like [Candidatus Nitrosotalea devanaterra]